MDSLRKVFAGQKKSKNKTPKVGPKKKPVVVLVIQSDRYNWYEIFQGKTLTNGRPISVEQVSWSDILISGQTSKHAPCYVHIKHKRQRPLYKTAQKKQLWSTKSTVVPNFVLIRNEVYTSEEDFRKKLFGLMYAGLPSVNSLQSIYNFCERPIIYGELIKLHHQYGDEFPLINQEYFSSHRGMMYGLGFPAVAKVGHAHAGVGKMKVMTHHDMEDFRSVLAMTKTYVTIEPYYEGEYDLRIQKIGSHYRAFKRVSVSGNWKTNTGSSDLEEIDVTEKYKKWADLASQMFGGLDILTVDAIHCKQDNKEIILEVNGTSSGLSPFHDEVDNKYIADLVISKLNEIYTGSSDTASPSTSPTLIPITAATSTTTSTTTSATTTTTTTITTTTVTTDTTDTTDTTETTTTTTTPT